MQVGIWRFCHHEVRSAVEAFNSRSEPFSMASKRYSFLRLIREEIDIPLANFRSELECKYTLFNIPGLSGEKAFSEIIRVTGVRRVEDQIRKALRKFVDSMVCAQNDFDRCFIETAETLIEILIVCRCKQPRRKQSVDSHLNLQRPREFCCLCGALSEYTEHLKDPQKWGLIDEEEKQRLSHKYCQNHRPRHREGTWNYEYRRAVRSREQFNMEVDRLLRQSAQPAELKFHSGDLDIDLFIMNLIAQTTLQPADEDKIRHLARELVNHRMSDRKKQILMMLASGFKQSEIARELKLSRQAISKAVKSVPKGFIQ